MSRKNTSRRKLLSLWSPLKSTTIASGATPIGSAGRAPDEKYKKEGSHFFVYAGRNKERQDNHQRIFESIPEFFSTIPWGATPIGSAGRVPDENEVINHASKDRSYRTCIGAKYRLPCQKINICHYYSLIHSHREGFASSRARTTRRFWVMKQPNKAQDKIVILKPRCRNKKLECHDYHEGKTSGSVLHGLVYAHE
jgi:hypothetical protein